MLNDRQTITIWNQDLTHCMKWRLVDALHMHELVIKNWVNYLTLGFESHRELFLRSLKALENILHTSTGLQEITLAQLVVTKTSLTKNNKEVFTLKL